MSLINDVLRDLQTRQGPRAQPLAGLQPVTTTRRGPGLRWAAVPAIALALATTAWAAWRTAGAPGHDASSRDMAIALPQAAPDKEPPLISATPVALTPEHDGGVPVAEAAPAPLRKPRWATLADFARSLESYDGATGPHARATPLAASRPSPPPGVANAAPSATHIGAPAAVAGDNVERASTFANGDAKLAQARSPSGSHAAGIETESTAVAEAGSIVVSRRSPGEGEGQRLRAALLALQNGKPAEAEAALRQITAQNPGFAEAWIHLALSRTHQGKRDLAERTLYDALAQVERPEIVARALARHMLAAERTGDAIVVLETFRPAGKDADHEAFLAALYQRAGRHPEAVSIYRRLLNDDPGHGAWWMGLAISEEGIGRPAAALAAYRRIDTLAPVEPLLRDYAAQRIAALGDVSGEVAQQ